MMKDLPKKKRKFQSSLFFFFCLKSLQHFRVLSAVEWLNDVTRFRDPVGHMSVVSSVSLM